MKGQRVSKTNFDYEYEQDIQGNTSRQPFGDVRSKAPFYKTTKGKAVIIIAVIGFLAIAGGFAGLFYWVGMQNAPTVNANTLSPQLQQADSTIDSTILTAQEKYNLISLTNIKAFNLCYRATRDGFSSLIFHKNCDNIIGTLTVYRSNYNNVFGGFTTATWNSISAYKSDSNAYLFSLRRRGYTNSERFNVTSSTNAIYTQNSYFPTFGGGHDINIRDSCDITTGSYSNFCSSYQCPVSYVAGNTYLAGLPNNFLVDEIEVYQVNV